MINTNLSAPDLTRRPPRSPRRMASRRERWFSPSLKEICRSRGSAGPLAVDRVFISNYPALKTIPRALRLRQPGLAGVGSEAIRHDPVPSGPFLAVAAGLLEPGAERLFFAVACFLALFCCSTRTTLRIIRWWPGFASARWSGA